MLRRARIELDSILQTTELIKRADRVVVLTGAGTSTPSGIPDFRSEFSGLWNFINPFEVASLWGFRDHPERFYEWMQPLARIIDEAKPNPAHLALAEMERRGYLHLLITQNIDALHQKAGSRRVVELHGHLRTLTCLACGHRVSAEHYLPGFIRRGSIPVCPECESVLKPDVILFGEPLPERELLSAQEAALHADLLIVVGSSLEAMPAADLPPLAVRGGAKLVMINLGVTPYDHLADLQIKADVATALPAIVKALG